MGIKVDYVSGEDYKSANHNHENRVLRMASTGFFGDGADGPYNLTVGTDTIDADNKKVVVKRYTSFVLAAGTTLTFNNISNEGLVFLLLVDGDINIASTATINLAGLGCLGGTGQTSSMATDTGTDTDIGILGTATTFTDLRQGSVGQANTAIGLGGSAESVVTCASGAGGSSTPLVSASNSTAAVNGGIACTAAAANAGITISNSENYLKQLYNQFVICESGAGGSAGGTAVRNYNATGTSTATAGNGGRGGASIVIHCNGDYINAGTINCSGANATDGTASASSTGSGEWSAAASAGGSAGGAGGSVIIQHIGNITDGSATYTVTAGSGGASATNTNGAGAGASLRAAVATAAGASSNGFIIKEQIQVIS